MVPNATMTTGAFSVAKEKLSTNASGSEIETSNRRDEENAAQVRVSPLSAHVAIQRSGVPECAATKAVLLQSLSKARSPEPPPSLLLRRTTAIPGRHLRRDQTARSIDRHFDTL